ncbi:hypothetical protein ACQY1F_14150 [Agrobacterium vitis]|uniref:hypothetical protein n=1 Tax=Agrobacterium vitis TaxID=373 RepID=UPI003D280AD2
MSLDAASGPTSGLEQQGTCPVLIILPGLFNRLTKTPVVLGSVSLGARIPPSGLPAISPSRGEIGWTHLPVSLALLV